MKAIALTHYLPSDHPDCFIEVNLADPTPGPRDLLVRVNATSINPVDTKVRAPKAKVESSPRVLGWDAVGTVDAVREITGLIEAQRGYELNAKVITAADQMMATNSQIR